MLNICQKMLTFALLALVAVVVTACLRVELAITVNEDGSGEISQLLAFDAELIMELLGEELDSSEMMSDLTGEDAPEGFQAHPYEEGKFKGIRYTGSFDADDVGSLRAKLDALEGANETGNTLEDLSLSREGLGWRFSVIVPPLGDAMTDEDEEFASALAMGLLDDATYEIRVSLPGDLLEHNADRVDNGSLVWEIGFLQTEPRSLTALTGEDEAGAIEIIIGVAFLLIVGAVIGGLVFLAIRRLRRPKPDREADQSSGW